MTTHQINTMTLHQPRPTTTHQPNNNTTPTKGTVSNGTKPAASLVTEQVSGLVRVTDVVTKLPVESLGYMVVKSLIPCLILLTAVYVNKWMKVSERNMLRR